MTPEINVLILNSGLIVTQKPKGIALTIQDMRAKDNDNFITHYGEDHSIETVATFTNPTITDVELIKGDD